MNDLRVMYAFAVLLLLFALALVRIVLRGK